MPGRFGIERRDGRNLAVVMAVMALIMFGLGDGPVAVRAVIAAVGAVVSGVVFVVVTVAIKTYGPGY